VVEPFAVVIAGMVAMVAVLGVAVRARRVALTAALSAPVAALEPAQEH
jgi:hypothetical protein